MNDFTLYVTYGLGTNLAKRYSVVKGASYRECRSYVEQITKGHFAFTYTESEFAGQPEEYGLTEVPLQQQIEHY